ncbi:MAG: hypothetical protein ACJ74W_17470 [Pyrinomonadaceae bacterium]
MDSFTTRQATPANAACDPTKRVNYSFGMVLSVDDFVQEQSYHIGRAEWMARDLFGYGTVSGLAVSVGKNGQNEMEVNVTAGAAVSPRGQMIRVAPAQCANLSKWLAVEENRRGVRDRVGEPPTGPVSLYVVLCYRDCPTDKVPIPGEPCRSEDDAVAASRLTDDFKLELRFAPPSQLEEDALRDFVQWLEMNLEITDEPGAFTDLATLRTNLLQAAAPVTSPPTSPPDFMLDSPPAPMRVHTSDACAFLREAFRLWVTELRPRWRPVSFGAGCCGDQVDEQGHEEEECVLLAELVVPLTAESLIDDAQEVAVHEERRPFVLHLRMLQEWLLCGKFGQIVAGVSSPPDLPPPPPPPPQQLALDDLIDVDAPGPQENQVLMFQGEGGWRAANLPAGGTTGPAGGDLNGTYPDPNVVRLQKRTLSSDQPNDGDVLTWQQDGEMWLPRRLPAAPPARQTITRLLPFATISPPGPNSPNIFRCWLNLDAPLNRVTVRRLTTASMQIQVETTTAPDFLTPLRFSIAPVAGARNLFDVQVAQNPLLRFNFDLSTIIVQVEGRDMTVLDYMQATETSFAGFDGRATATVFVPGAARVG